MAVNYNEMKHEVFLEDLYAKQFVGLLMDQDDLIKGFTTIAINPEGSGTEEYNIVFSGDTIISPENWGTNELVRGFCYTMGQIAAMEPKKKLYWYLLSKGHRTYMYLPLFFRRYFPACSKEHALDVFFIVDRCSKLFYPENWKPNEGILFFNESLGELNEELAQATWQKKHNKYVNFFLKKNPDFYKGNELVCMTEYTEENMLGTARKYFVKGMENPLQIEK